MQRVLICALAMLMLTRFAAAAEEPPFSKAVSPADFPAAGLNKLSPQELARLDALVRDYKTGALEAARREAAAAAAARADAEARAARSEAEARAAKAEAQVKAARTEAQVRTSEETKKPDRSLLARAKVLLTPGTEIEYSTVESRIAGNFDGWDGRTIFALENGQRWQSEGGSYITKPVSRPAVKIAPGALGSFWMTVEGVKPRVKVKILSDAK